MSLIAKNLSSIKDEIRAAELSAQRQRHSVALLAVSKTKPSTDLIQAYQAGQRHFGESYLQEALIKQKELANYLITWHFIGPIQSNKTKPIAAHFSWVHSVDRLKIAQRLSEQRPSYLPDLNICIQVNISNEASKSGFLLEELPQVIEKISALPNIKLRGVMAIPKPEVDHEQQKQPFRELFQTVNALQRPELDTFSFGMSADLQAAIAEGSTMVRIGSAIFGARDYS